ncbi:Gfo/Idh/MocA family protein [Methylobacterium sp. NEAU K]|uniref:Gfo/Idh/MocA family protein n=1 Tax=Methylobacterium sp. NEAU K TaxID=3064946 RepID=UPI002734578B|nr:Gfo/Idh/MocA family oxidoreductase [Methylobacterium sp. NEAU K]MDP4006136.1 Gfo/Idh/MocA family oxidoreductase [Methylobacterium sp. NEAU K]
MGLGKYSAPRAVHGAGLGIAFVGCGYVADMYRYCLRHHAGALALVGVYDRDPGRLAAFARCWGDSPYPSLDALLADPRVGVVVNLTDPESHAAVTGAAIAAGKHVYSEKPLGMSAAEAVRLCDTAAARGVRLAAAPSNLLGEQAQTLWRAVRAGAVGRVRLVYAELDDGMIHRADYRRWISRSGRRWPAENEFETGCTFEHAGYVITLLVAMFGPVRRVSAHAALLVPEKGCDRPIHPAPDFSCGCLEFDGGILARLTNSIVGPYDHRLRVIGDAGVLEVEEPWDFAAPVRLKRTATTRLERLIERRFPRRRGRIVKRARPVPFRGGRGRPTMDFLRGVREFAEAIAADRPCRLGADLAVHVTEVTEMLQHPERFPRPAAVASGVVPMRAMDWAE